MWEMISDVPAFNDVPHDFNLSLAIYKGLRSRVIDDTEPEFVKLMKRCWDSDPSKTAKELLNEDLSQELSSKIITCRYYDDYSDEIIPITMKV
ncbi:hypothetical protein C1646_752018 [Rhizophagus diaphanus]|nr:hypothetical protein C1646_752018 [Rhizophagus diaphanus] [Rhizophagus sp. MUCL 43196]